MLLPARKRSGHAWSKIRDRAMRRDAGLCQHCLRKGAVTAATEVDHILALINGGTDDEANLQCLCHECHEVKTRADLGQKVRTTTGIDGWPVT